MLKESKLQAWYSCFAAKEQKMSTDQVVESIMQLPKPCWQHALQPVATHHLLTQQCLWGVMVSTGAARSVASNIGGRTWSVWQTRLASLQAAQCHKSIFCMSSHLPCSLLHAGHLLMVPCPDLSAGSRDTQVIVWDPVTASPIHTLKGHQYQVTAVGWLPSGEAVSASLDK